MPTERDVILAKRQGWVAAKRDNYSNLAPNLVEEFERRAAVEEFERRAAIVYPLPMIERPRVMSLGNLHLMLVDGKLRWRTNSSEAWWSSTLSVADMRGYLGDLVVKPTVLVPDDGTEPAA